VTHFPNDTPVDILLDHYQIQLESKLFLGDAWPKWWPNIGPGIGAGFLGAQVLTAEDTVWFEPTVQKNIQDIRLAYDGDNYWWQRIQALTQAAVERWGDRVCVGFTDIGGNLDILASLHTTQKLATDLYDKPEEVLRLVHEINHVWLQYYDGLHDIIGQTGRGTTPWAPIWSPKRTYMLQSDFSFMISPEMFEQFVMPDLIACCERIDHAFYHLDGRGELPHLDMLLSIDRLRGIQWIPGAGQPEPQEWLPLLQHIRRSGKLNQVFVTPEGARKIVREIGGKGFVFCIEAYMAVEDAEAFLKVLEVEDVGEIGAAASFYQYDPGEQSNGQENVVEAAEDVAELSRDEEILDDVFNYILDGGQEMVSALTQEGLALGMKPADLLFEAMIPALEEVGRLFENGDFFVPEMLVSARAMQGGMDVLRPFMSGDDVKPLGTFILGTVQGDIHDIGKNLVNIMLEGAGFKVIDLGVNVPPETFVEAIQTHQADAVGMSAFLTTTLPMLDKSMAAIEKAGLRDQVKILIGGAPVTQEYCDLVKADGFATDASKAVRLTKQLLGIPV
jgi:methanogenic corrinoid protein MtbC1